jgi:uncharacterized protein YndB with AHSA1/START domain
MPQRFVHTVVIDAPPWFVWESLTRTERIKEWIADPQMEIAIETDWSVGGPIIMRGFHHVPFTNSGLVLAFEPPTRLSYTHLSSISRLPSRPESYTTLDFHLDPVGHHTSLELAATGFPTEAIFKHLEFYWRATLEILKQHAQRRWGLTKTQA